MQDLKIGIQRLRGLKEWLITKLNIVQKMRERFIEFLKTSNYNLITSELYEYFNNKTKVRMSFEEFIKNLSLYLNSGLTVQNFINEKMLEYKINTIIKDGKIINYY